MFSGYGGDRRAWAIALAPLAVPNAAPRLFGVAGWGAALGVLLIVALAPIPPPSREEAPGTDTLTTGLYRRCLVETRSDKDGRFEIEGIEAGPSALHLFAPDARYGWDMAGKPFGGTFLGTFNALPGETLRLELPIPKDRTPKELRPQEPGSQDLKHQDSDSSK